MAKKSGYTAKDLFKKAISLFVEEEEEIVSNGLDDAEISESRTEKVTESIISDEVEKTEEKESDREAIKEPAKGDVKDKVKSKPIFAKPKHKTLEQDLFTEEEEPNIMDEMKSMPFQSVEIIEIETPVAKVEGKEGYKKVASLSENITEELTQEQKEKDLFFSKLDKGEAVISKLMDISLFNEIKDEVFGDGFEGMFYSLMEAIEDNQLLEKQDKLDKMNDTLAKLMKVNMDEEAEIFNFFVMLRHELHKVKNSLGEYDAKVLEDKELKVKTVLNYDISDMYQNAKYVEYLSESDNEKYAELQNLVRDMYFEVEENKFVAKEKKEQMHEEYRDILLSSNTIVDVLKNIEILKDDLHMIRNEIGRFSRTSLVLD